LLSLNLRLILNLKNNPKGLITFKKLKAEAALAVIVSKITNIALSLISKTRVKGTTIRRTTSLAINIANNAVRRINLIPKKALLS